MSETEGLIASSAKPVSSAFRLVPAVLSDQRKGFEEWLDSMGVLAQESLDHRLRNAPELIKTVVETLEALAELLQDYADITQGKLIPWNQLPADEDEPFSTAAGEPATELEQIQEHVKVNVGGLFELNTTINQTIERTKG